MKPMKTEEIVRLLDQIVEAQQVHDLQREQSQIQELVRNPDQVIEPLIRLLREPDKERWSPAMLVLARIGYPLNAQSLPVAISHIGDSNSLAWPEAAELLKGVPIDTLVQELIAKVWENMRSHNRWKWTAGEVYSTAFYTHPDFPIRTIEPLVAYILSQSRLLHQLSAPELLLKVAEAGGLESIRFILPALLFEVEKHPEREFARYARDFLATLSDDVLSTYKHIR